MVEQKTHPYFIVGINDSDFIIDGWYERTIHKPTGLFYRPTKQSASFKLPVVGDLTEKNIFIFVAGSPSLVKKNVMGKVFCNDILLGDFSLETDLWQLISFPLQKVLSPGDSLKFLIKTEISFIPHIYLNNNDYREMGVYFSFALIK